MDPLNAIVQLGSTPKENESLQTTVKEGKYIKLETGTSDKLTPTNLPKERIALTKLARIIEKIVEAWKNNETNFNNEMDPQKSRCFD